MPGEDWDALERWWARSVKRVDLAARIRDSADVDDRKGGGAVHARALAARGRARARLAAVRAAAAGRARADSRHVDGHRRQPGARRELVRAQGLRPSQRAAGRRGGQLPGHVPGLVDVRARGADDRFQPDVDAVTIEGRHVDPYNEVANPKYPNPGFTIPVSHGSELDVLRLRQPHPQPRRLPSGAAGVDPPLPQRTGRPQDQITSFKL